MSPVTPSERFYRPRGPATAKDRLERFAELNREVTAAGGWITSLPGAEAVALECLPESSLPSDLRAAGHDVREAGEGERILPLAIVQRSVRRADGELEPATVGSTRPVAETRTHAGIARVLRICVRLKG